MSSNDGKSPPSMDPSSSVDPSAQSISKAGINTHPSSPHPPSSNHGDADNKCDSGDDLFDSAVSSDEDGGSPDKSAVPSRVGKEYAYFGVTSNNEKHWLLTKFLEDLGSGIVKVIDADVDDRTLYKNISYCAFIYILIHP